MRKSKYTDEQIAFALRQAETGTRVEEICRLRQLEDENRRLKQLFADLSLDKEMLQEVIKRDDAPIIMRMKEITETRVRYGE